MRGFFFRRICACIISKVLRVNAPCVGYRLHAGFGEIDCTNEKTGSEGESWLELPPFSAAGHLQEEARRSYRCVPYVLRISRCLFLSPGPSFSADRTAPTRYIRTRWSTRKDISSSRSWSSFTATSARLEEARSTTVIHRKMAISRSVS